MDLPAFEKASQEQQLLGLEIRERGGVHVGRLQGGGGELFLWAQERVGIVLGRSQNDRDFQKLSAKR